METISIINKSGKVVSTTKHLVNIFKDAKEAYQDKKAEIRAENRRELEYKTAQKMLKAREEVRSDASRHHRHRSGSRDMHSSRDPNLQRELPRRPALTERALSETSSRHGSRQGSRHGSHRNPRSPTSPVAYQRPFFEDAEFSRPDLTRRHTEAAQSHRTDQVARSPFPPPARSMTSPNLHHDEDVDLNLAYGDIPPPLPPNPEREVHGLMSKLNTLMTEAQCVQHSATTIIAGLQKNPEAMAAVALTLAELSSLLSKMSPGILTAIKSGSPAVFALLASPQFLIAGGVAVGVTIVMFGGYKIIKKIQKDAMERKEVARVDEALVFEGDLNSIESWRRGIAEVESQSVATSVDGEFITPEAARQRRERIRDRAREERPRPKGADRLKARAASSVDGSERTIRRKEIPVRTSSRSVVAESVRSESTVKPKKEERKAKKPSALTVLFKRSTGKDKKGKEVAHKQPKMLEM